MDKEIKEYLIIKFYNIFEFLLFIFMIGSLVFVSFSLAMLLKTILFR
jgi:hypothetical protein